MPASPAPPESAPVPRPPLGRARYLAAEMAALIRESVEAFINDEALTRGASIAFYALTSLAPVLVIVIAIAGIVFGRDAASGAIAGELSDLMGHESAALLEGAIKSASSPAGSLLATVIGLAALVVTASGVFSEMQSALNIIWKAPPVRMSLTGLLRARASSVGLVAAFGFLLIISLVVSAGLTALADYIDAKLFVSHLILVVLNGVLSYALLTILFAAIYKMLPDKRVEWRDVLIGAPLTALLFDVGKSLIGLYIGSSAVASAYGAAGALIVILLWIYYSAQIFLFGAEVTKVYAGRYGSHQDSPELQAGGQPNTGQQNGAA